MSQRKHGPQWLRCRWTESRETKSHTAFHLTGLLWYIMHASCVQSEKFVPFHCWAFGGADSFIIQCRGSSHLTKLICIHSKGFQVEATLHNLKSVWQICLICSCFVAPVSSQWSHCRHIIIPPASNFHLQHLGRSWQATVNRSHKRTAAFRQTNRM